jgi:Calcineurin-like phosphoesterase
VRPTLASYANLSRLAPQSHFMSLKKAGGFSPLHAYSPANILAWLTHVGAYWFGKRHPFVVPTLPETGIYPIRNTIRIAIAGDWGTGTNEADRVGQQIRAGNPDITIHLGDVYYTGTRVEILENFLGQKVSKYEPVEWPRGSLGSWTLLGNHEMYTHGFAYFDLLLPALGQPASFFCLQNDFWRIVGLDTGYNGTGTDFWPLRPSCKIPDEVLNWLASLNLMGDERGIIILTHHQPWSAFDNPYPNSANQLAFMITRPFLWFWGHEHRMAIYEKRTLGVTAHGRCLGHGGMPVTLKKPDDSTCKCLFTDAREYPNSEGITVGFNGFASLFFNGAGLRVSYKDLNGLEVYAENWTPETLK